MTAYWHYEELMLEMLTFDLLVDSPYARLYDYMSQLELVHNKRCATRPWAFCNDACLTVLPLLLNARDVAIAAIFFATSVTREKIDDVGGSTWWQYLKGLEASTVVRVSSWPTSTRRTRCASRTPGPSSPEFNLEHPPPRRAQRQPWTSTRASTARRPRWAPTAAAPKPRPGAGGSKLNGKVESSDAKDVVVKEDTSDIRPGQPPERQRQRLGAGEQGDSDAALKLAANDLSTHDTRSSTLNGSIGGGLVSPMIKRRSVEPEDGEERSRRGRS